MKILIVSEYNHFVSIGGTEYYVKLLIDSLCKKGFNVVLITIGHNDSEINKRIISENSGIYQIYFLPKISYSKKSIRLQQISESWEWIEQILQKEKPDLIHVHTFTTFFNHFHIEQSLSFCKSIVFTSHVSEHYCSRGDLIYMGKRPCDGNVGFKCAVCLFSKGFKTGISNLLRFSYDKLLKEIIRLQEIGVQLICVSDWQKNHLLANGCSDDKISVIRQALSSKENIFSFKASRSPIFTIGYLGRLTHAKGASLLLEILRKVVNVKNIRFVLGIPLENSDSHSVELLRKIINDSNGSIVLMKVADDVAKRDFFNIIDCLFIPSFSFETGPIVLLEAVSFGKMVVAPDIGGPLEFAKQYPYSIIFYRWNNVDSVLETIFEIMKKKTNQNLQESLPFFHNSDMFITQHLNIYNRLISKY